MDDDVEIEEYAPDSDRLELFGGPLDGLLHCWTPDDPCPVEYTPLGPFLALWEGLQYTVETLERSISWADQQAADRGPDGLVGSQVILEMTRQAEEMGAWRHLAYLKSLQDEKTMATHLSLRFVLFPDPKPLPRGAGEDSENS